MAEYRLPGVVTPWSPEKAFPPPATEVPPPEPWDIPEHVRQSYTDSLLAGTALGGDDFHQAYHNAGHEPIPGLATALPSQQTWIDGALQTVQQNSLPPDPALVQQTKQNLMDHWAKTGQSPDQVIQDPALRDQMSRTPAQPQPLGPLIQHLETGGMADPDAAVSPTGALGRNQIEPSTAREYGFDPAKLHDAAYNNEARDAILSDLSNRFHGETAAILIGYNAGPGVAEKWIASGRDNSVLPQETQNYLRQAAHSGPDMMAPAQNHKFDPTPGISFTQKVQQAAADFADEWEKQENNPEFAGANHTTLGALLKRENPDEQQEATNLAINFTPLGVGALTGEGIRAMFSTSDELAAHSLNMGAKSFVQQTIRAETGTSRQFKAAASDALEQFRSTVNKGIPDFKAWLDKGPGIATSMWQGAPDIAHLIDHIEGGAGGGQLAADSPLRPVADAIKGIYGEMRATIEDEFPDMEGFIDDYYRHLWERPTDADRVMGSGRQGSIASLLKRVIPTIMEGIAKGLRPRIIDPIENTLHYVAGMRDYIAARRVLQQGIEAGYVKFAHQIPHDGWQELKGRGATNLGGARAYAPAGYAGSYNAFVGRGVYDWAGPKGVKIYDNLQRGAILTTALKLALSGFHAFNIVKESVIAGFANAIGEIAHGELVRGLKDMGLSVTVLPHLARSYTRGSAITDAYLSRAGASALDTKMATLIANAGGRVVGRGAEYGYAQAANWFTAFRRGSLAQELKEGAIGTPLRILTDPAKPLLRQAYDATNQVGAFFGHEFGRVMATVTAPLFDHIIPRLKTAAVADEMSSWLRQNPLASDQAAIAHMTKLVDSMDDRFGEMIQDNLFWNRNIKQMLNLGTVSVGWEYGTFRAFGGAAKDLLRGDVLSPRARWLMAFPVVMAFTSSIYQYFKTGLAGPTVQTPTRDMVAPRTGGTTPYGAPERAILPGYEKDVLQWYRLLQDAPDFTALPSAVAGYAAGKLNPLGQIVKGTITGKDWQGNSIWSQPPDPNTMLPPPGWKDYAEFVLGQLTPIQLEQQANRYASSAIGTGERAMGIKPAPGWVEDPEGVAAAEAREKAYQERDAARRAARAQALQQQ